MRITARQVLGTLGVLALMALWALWGYWLHWVITAELSRETTANNGLGIFALGGVLGTVTVFSLIDLWKHNPTITIGKK